VDSVGEPTVRCYVEKSACEDGTKGGNSWISYGDKFVLLLNLSGMQHRLLTRILRASFSWPKLDLRTSLGLSENESVAQVVLPEESFDSAGDFFSVRFERKVARVQ
jgi:hypothetical protein